jgi:hypothetical protein
LEIGHQLATRFLLQFAGRSGVQVVFDLPGCQQMYQQMYLLMLVYIEVHGATKDRCECSAFTAQHQVPPSHARSAQPLVNKSSTQITAARNAFASAAHLVLGQRAAAAGEQL